MMLVGGFILFFLPCICAELKHVHIVYRHGDRSPVSIYPRDVHQANAWPMGLGQLTKIGKQQHFRLGKFFRKRYNGFLSPQYSVTEFYIRATDVDRTLMSAESNLAGLYLPTSQKDRFDADINWNPVPIHTVPCDEDPLLRGGDVCPRLDQLVADMAQSPLIQKEEAKNHDLYVMLRKETGIPVKVNISDVWEIIDTIICEKSHNLSQPSWLTPSLFNRLISIDNFGWDIKFYYPEMRRLRGGVLLSDIMNRMLLIGSGRSNLTIGKKMFVYSAHDTTVASFLSSALVFNLLAPPYASAVLIELHLENNAWLVKMFYHNESNREPYPLTIRGCSVSCPLQLLPKLWANELLAAADYTAACQARLTGVDMLSRGLSYSFALICLAGVFAVFGAILAYVVRQSRYRKYRRVGQIQDEEGDLR